MPVDALVIDDSKPMQLRTRWDAMRGNIVVIQSRGDAQSAFVQIDVAAVRMLADGRATSLRAARTEVILADLREQRDEMSAMLSDLWGWVPANDAWIDETDANLMAAIIQGIVQIDLFVAQARAYTEGAVQAG